MREPVPSGHGNVSEEDVGALALQDGETGVCGVGDRHGRSAPLQDGPEQLPGPWEDGGSAWAQTWEKPSASGVSLDNLSRSSAVSHRAA